MGRGDGNEEVRANLNWAMLVTDVSQCGMSSECASQMGWNNHMLSIGECAKRDVHGLSFSGVCLGCSIANKMNVNVIHCHCDTCIVWVCLLRCIISTDQLKKDIKEARTSFSKSNLTADLARWSPSSLVGRSEPGSWDWHQRFASVSPLMWLHYCVIASLTKPASNLN